MMRAKYGEAVEEAIGRARASGGREAVEAFDGAEAYAYPRWPDHPWTTHFDLFLEEPSKSCRKADGAATFEPIVISEKFWMLRPLGHMP